MANQVPQKSTASSCTRRSATSGAAAVAYIIKDWHPHDQYLMDTMPTSAATCSRFGGDGGKGSIRSRDRRRRTGENALARIANHILGGARFGTDPHDSVLDPDCRAWDFDNLYRHRRRFMPTSGSGNPTLTIQANAFRVGDALLGRL